MTTIIKFTRSKELSIPALRHWPYMANSSENVEGEYVSLTEYQMLQAEIARLQTELDTLKRQLDALARFGGELWQ